VGVVFVAVAVVAVEVVVVEVSDDLIMELSWKWFLRSLVNWVERKQ
jgi:hypothetical protein